MADLSHFSILIGCILGLVTIPTCIADYIYFASPGGAQGGDRPGMYGGPVRTDENGVGSKMYSSGYHCAVLEEPDTFNDMQFRSISYDPVSKNVLMHVQEQFTLLKSPVCRAQPHDCVAQSRYVSPIFIKRQFSDDIKPVAMYDSTVYFLRYNSETVDTKDKDAKLEIRKLVGCDDQFPITGNKAFDLQECSQLVALIREERYKFAPTFKTADHLIIHRDGRGLRFFTIIQKFAYEGRKLESYKFQLVTIFGGKVEVLDEQEVDRSFNMYSLNQLGGLSYKDGVICWSAISRILCGDWRGTDLVNRRVIVDDVSATKVCKGSSERQTANVTTGVAIASVSPDLVVYFGCLMDANGKGGMGMIRVKSDGSSEIKNVTNDGAKVLAGSMFITKECKSDKPPKPSNGNHPTISGGTNPSKEESERVPEPAGASYASSANGAVTLGLVTYTHLLMAAFVTARRFL